MAGGDAGKAASYIADADGGDVVLAYQMLKSEVDN